MPTTQQAAHVVDPVYATPVLRSSSPAESINTEYGPPDTTMDDVGTDDEDFARRVEEQIGLRRSVWAEAGSPKPVILPRPPKDSKEEQGKQLSLNCTFDSTVCTDFLVLP